MKYPLIVQAGPQEILEVEGPDSLIYPHVAAWPSIREVLTVLPEMEGSAEAAVRLREWGMEVFVGDAYNVAQRLVDASGRWPDMDFCVRVLAIWKHVDFAYVDRMVEAISTTDAEVAASPRDFDITMAADVMKLSCLRRIAALGGDSQLEQRARFNPWGYAEFLGREGGFEICHVEPAPAYDAERVQSILSDKRNHPENEYFGRDYAGSRYHRLVEQLGGNLGRVLDIACGSGFGSRLLVDFAAEVVGVDYLESYVSEARGRYPESGKLRFQQGDGAGYLEEGAFDLVVTLHTLEHVPDDRAMLDNLFRNLKPGGRLVAEVPVQCLRPLGVPINPWHFREYRVGEFVDLVKAAGFEIERVYGSSRSFYGEAGQARDAVQVWGRK